MASIGSRTCLVSLRNNGCVLPLQKKYRSHFEIMASMLEAAKDKCVGGFSIMQYTSLTWKQLKKYLNSLSQMGFMEKHNTEGQITYKSTDKGLAFLRQYYVLQEMIQSSQPQTI